MSDAPFAPVANYVSICPTHRLAPINHFGAQVVRTPEIVQRYAFIFLTPTNSFAYEAPCIKQWSGSVCG